LNAKYDEPLSNFAFKINLRRYNPGYLGAFYVEGTGASEAGLHYASTGKAPAAALVWFAWDDPDEYASWTAGEEHLMVGRCRLNR